MSKISASRQITDNMLRNIIVKRLPKLLEKEPVLRDYLANLLSEKFADKRKTEETIETILLTIREQNKRLEEQNKRLEEHSKIIEEILKEVKSLRRDYDRTLSALGTRWGLHSEHSFREGLKAILERDFGVKVDRYHVKDEVGKVFGKPDQVEIDLIIRNGKVIAIEIKSSGSKADLSIFWRKVKFYEELEGKKVDRMIFISPMVDPFAKNFSEETGIEVYCWPEEIEFKKT